MPTKREREYYRMGFADGIRAGRGLGPQYGIEPDTSLPSELLDPLRGGVRAFPPGTGLRAGMNRGYTDITKPKRKLSAWNKFVKANSKKKEFRYANGKLKLKKMGIAFRKKRRR